MEKNQWFAASNGQLRQKCFEGCKLEMELMLVKLAG